MGRKFAPYYYFIVHLAFHNRRGKVLHLLGKLLAPNHDAQREACGDQRVYERTGLRQINSQTLLARVPRLTLLLWKDLSINSSTYLSFILRNNKKV